MQNSAWQNSVSCNSLKLNSINSNTKKHMDQEFLVFKQRNLILRAFQATWNFCTNVRQINTLLKWPSEITRRHSHTSIYAFHRFSQWLQRLFSNSSTLRIRARENTSLNHKDIIKISVLNYFLNFHIHNSIKRLLQSFLYNRFR